MTKANRRRRSDRRRRAMLDWLPAVLVWSAAASMTIGAVLGVVL